MSDLTRVGQIVIPMNVGNRVTREIVFSFFSFFSPLFLLSLLTYINYVCQRGYILGVQINSVSSINFRKFITR